MLTRKNVYIVDDDVKMRSSTVCLLAAAGFHPHAYDSGAAFLNAVPSLPAGCALVDIRMSSMDGEQVITGLGERIQDVPVIMMSDHGDIDMAVRTMQRGAIDFLPKPFHQDKLLNSLDEAFRGLRERSAGRQRRTAARARLALLTAREAAVLAGLAEGHSNKIVAWRLDLSVRTVEMYRGHMMDRLSVKSLPEALQLLFNAEISPEKLSPAPVNQLEAA
jgi:two-component system response regulator FixJ